MTKPPKSGVNRQSGDESAPPVFYPATGMEEQGYRGHLRIEAPGRYYDIYGRNRAISQSPGHYGDLVRTVTLILVESGNTRKFYTTDGVLLGEFVGPCPPTWTIR